MLISISELDAVMFATRPLGVVIVPPPEVPVPFTAQAPRRPRLAAPMLLLLLATTLACAAPADDETPPPVNPAGILSQWTGHLTGQFSQAKQTVGEKTTDLLGQAMGLLGVPYRRGGTSENTGFDCSGFVRYVFQQAANLTLPHGARAISQVGTNISKNELQPGDLVFFNTLKSVYSHVGIYVGNNRFIHSPSAGGTISVTDMNDAYWAKRFTGARHIEAKDLAAVDPTKTTK